MRTLQIYVSGWNTARLDTPRQISAKDFQSETDGELIAVAVRGRTIVGFISVEEPDWFIHLLNVDAALHGEGIGTALITYAKGLTNGQCLRFKC